MLCNLKRSILGLAFLSSLATASGYDEQYPPGGGVGGKQDGKKPNFIFILTDDQDLHLDSLSYMPQLKKHITDQGTAFEKHYCTIAICCPSRVSLLTGRAAHNTNVTDVSPPYGGYPKFISEGWNEKYLPVWLQEAGYDTYYTGKLMNGFSTSAYNKPYPKGWTGTDCEEPMRGQNATVLSANHPVSSLPRPVHVHVLQRDHAAQRRAAEGVPRGVFDGPGNEQIPGFLGRGHPDRKPFLPRNRPHRSPLANHQQRVLAGGPRGPAQGPSPGAQGSEDGELQS